MSFAAPTPLADHHNLDNFDSGVASLDEWLRRRARANQAAGASRTFVICEGDDVAGYYALSSGSISTIEASGRMRRNMPEPIPVVVLGRLAIGKGYQGQGIGRAMVRDAAKRVIAAGDEIGIRGIVVHAISEEAKSFYLAIGFLQSPTADMTLMIPISDLKAAL
ncbi:GNAT family N-acetyltransferase [Sphingobium sp. HWE2-09]|uniref:GNAT family N-acetyltransferase n=1 Tax=Sphingobium sp. HWE2-09 TaxID=3108390 RepID=UPI002DC1C1B8|nr:GNAT family N-acetyltransferase [Sphingobium sp. HWE2-09]